MKNFAMFAALAAAGLFAGFADRSYAVDQGQVQATINATFKGAPEDWRKRIEPDETQLVCSKKASDVTEAELKKVQAIEAANVVLPADGQFLGDWKNGEALAQRGTGGQFSDKPDTPKGGNCYACHQLAAKEVSYGTLGPSLLAYGKARKFTPEATKAAYIKIYNAQAVQPCSNMPRFGHNKFLTEAEMKDLTAYLMDPASPVNK
ncbi:MAG: sulfur oxidation c-type cytochrome SoxX [Hyphomicrobiaceae bacterium]|nr:sulfur oxidation c-type cytochrome SoxX [Hyphomicrobiaceae bacterium]